MNMSFLQFFNGLAGKIPFLREVAILVSRPIGYVPLLILALLPIFLTAKNRVLWLTLSLGSLGGAWVIARLMKLFFQIARPTDGIGEVLVYFKANGYSFPSEHASVFASLAVLGWYYDMRLGIALSILALFVGISRMVIGVHYPVDILTGFCVGTLVGIAVCTFGKQLL